MVLTAVLAFAGTGAVAAYLDFKDDIDVSDVDALLGTDRATPSRDPDDPFSGRALNILVMGTDYRGEGNDALAGDGDEFHSDTTLLVHVAGDRSRMEIVSIPRDSLVDIPACPLPGGGQSSPRRNAMFNSAFAIGGGPSKDVTGAAACTIRTVETLTGVPITDHVVVKMNGVIGVVDAIGGVPMCLPEPVKGNNHVDLDLPAGEVRLDGYQSINFLRARKGRGMGLELGSDLARIQRQQSFVDAMVREILAQNVITDSPRLYRLVQAVLKSISTNPGLADPAALAGLAWSVRGIDPADIVFTSLPVVNAPRDPNRVVWVERETDKIWERIAADQPPGWDPSQEPEPSDGGGDAGGSSTGPSGSPAPSAPDAASPPPDEPAPGDTGVPSPGSSAPAAEEPSPSPTPSLLPGVCG
ncbi:LytR family transcriptional regulator [Xylanimonas oleitrophica]|uniref:LytR family transcriptional regulator n=2 Tax=Xylanimonas oleitrophica TaxID=2607479 RepID=A0A2W5WXV0_9MICO|nr:LytR family transcriptional regulator [Xylanimonas oleitrophica]